MIITTPSVVHVAQCDRCRVESIPVLGGYATEAQREIVEEQGWGEEGILLLCPCCWDDREEQA